MPRRIMPDEGFYVRVKVLGEPADDLIEIIYCSGTTKNNKYWRPTFVDEGFANLLWTCVPGKQNLLENFEKVATESDARALLAKILT